MKNTNQYLYGIIKEILTEEDFLSQHLPTHVTVVYFTDGSSIESFDMDAKEIKEVIPHKGNKKVKNGIYFSDDITKDNIKDKLKVAKERGFIEKAKRYPISKEDAKKVMKGQW